MAKNNKLIHKCSSVSNKVPTANTLTYGELAVNYANGTEFISTRNSNDEVVKFSSDEQLINWIEKKTVIPTTVVVEGKTLKLGFNQIVAKETSGSSDVNNQVRINNVTRHGIQTDMPFIVNGDSPTFTSLSVSGGDVSLGDNVDIDFHANGDIHMDFGCGFTSQSLKTVICSLKDASSSALTSVYPANFVEGEFSAVTYNPGVEEKTIRIPKTISQVSNGHLVLTGSCLEVDVDICSSKKINAAEGFFQSSDINLKDNIEGPSVDKLISANNVGIKSFNYKDDASQRKVYGVIAQDVENNGLNEAVYTDENGVKSVDYTSLMILKIAYLENENKMMKQNLAMLTSQVEELKKKLEDK